MRCAVAHLLCCAVLCCVRAVQTNIVGLVYTQSDMIAKDVFLVECVDVIADAMVEELAEEESMRSQLRKGAIMRSLNVGVNEQNMQHLQAVVFVQPNAVTLDKLAILLKSPRYRDYHICKRALNNNN